MKKSQLKQILKPLIKECIKEVIFEDGILSGIISEVTKGVGQVPALSAPAPDPLRERMQKNAFNKEQSQKLKSQKKQLMSAIGKDAYNGVNLFEGTSPAPGESSVIAQAGALAGAEPGDSGVDISNLFGSVGRNWGAHMANVADKEKD